MAGKKAKDSRRSRPLQTQQEMIFQDTVTLPMQVSQRCPLLSFSKLCPSRTRASLMAVFCLAAPALARNTGLIAPGHGLCLERCWRGKWQPEAIRQFTLVLLALQMHCEETTPDAKARQHFSYFDCIHMFNTLQVLMVKEILPLRW